jgi:DNA replication and repair protein RecF
MFLKYLELNNFRNYTNVSLKLKNNLILFLGENGAGKTNLLESIYYLLTGKSHRIATQLDLIKHGSDYCVLRGIIKLEDNYNYRSNDINNKNDMNDKNDRNDNDRNGNNDGNGNKNEDEESNDNIIEIQLNKDGSTKIKFNKVYVKSKSIFTSNFATVIFCPDDLKIIKSTPLYRRNFLDDILEKTDKDFLSLRIRYQKILNQRNTLIKSINNFNISNLNNYFEQNEQKVADKKDEAKNNILKTLDIWNEKLIETGTTIIQKRLNLINKIKPNFIKYMTYFFNNKNFEIKYVFSWERLQSSNAFNDDNNYFEYKLNGESDNNSEVSKSENSKNLNEISGCFNYFSGFVISQENNDKLDNYNYKISSDIFKEKLNLYLKKDIFMKTTTVGPHRDDFLIYINGFDIKSFGSQGQQRIAAICLKLAEFDLLMQITKEKPILLLDDVLSELDIERKHLLLNLIGNNFQTFITAANFDYLKDIDLKYCEKYLVKDNLVTRYQDCHGDV